MKREFHVRFWESLRGKCPGATRPRCTSILNNAFQSDHLPCQLNVSLHIFR